MPQTKMTIEKLAEMSHQEFVDIKKSMATGFADVHSDIKLVLSAIENLSGQITDVEHTTRNVFDYARLEGHVEAADEKTRRPPRRLATRQKPPGNGGFWVTFHSGPVYYCLSGPLESASANQHPCVMAGSHDRAQAPSLLNLQAAGTTRT
jgi:hypothetical protein